MSQATVTSAVTNIQFHDNIGIELVWTGTPTGSFAVQVSANYDQDQNGNVLNSGNWVSVTLSPTVSAAGSADSAYIDLNQLSAPWIRVVYTKSGGTGTLNGWITGKTV